MNEPLVWFAERGCPQANRVTLTPACRCNNSFGNEFAHFRLAAVVKLFAGSLKSFTHRRGCLRFQTRHVLRRDRLAWPPPQKSRHKLVTSEGIVKYNSGYVLILQPLLASTSPPCKSICRALRAAQSALFRRCGSVLNDATRCRCPDCFPLADQVALAT